MKITRRLIAIIFLSLATAAAAQALPKVHGIRLGSTMEAVKEAYAVQGLKPAKEQAKSLIYERSLDRIEGDPWAVYHFIEGKLQRMVILYLNVDSDPFAPNGLKKYEELEKELTSEYGEPEVTRKILEWDGDRTLRGFKEDHNKLAVVWEKDDVRIGLYMFGGEGDTVSISVSYRYLPLTGK
jgi:hypothetical protein